MSPTTEAGEIFTTVLRGGIPDSATSLMAQSPTGIEALVRENTYRLELANGGLASDGADFLLQQARESQFVLVGEEHGNAETPAFVRALVGDLRVEGFRYLALEVGPHAAATLGVLPTGAEPAEWIVAFGEQHRVSLLANGGCEAYRNP